MTPFFRLWWRASRGMTLGVRVLAADAAGRILLVKHTYIKGWHFPGGGVEHGETALEAALRELAEEGAASPRGIMEMFGVYANAPTFPNDHVILFRAPEIETLPIKPDPKEIADYGFFPRDALPEGVTEGTRLRLAEAYDGAPLSTHWAPARRA